MSLPIESVFKSLGLKHSGFSMGRFLGSWVGILATPLWPMLKWTFFPFFPAAKIPTGAISVNTVVQFNTMIQQLSPSALLLHVLPGLLLCLGVCILFSTAFGWMGEKLEFQLRQLKSIKMIPRALTVIYNFTFS